MAEMLREEEGIGLDDDSIIDAHLNGEYYI